MGKRGLFYSSIGGNGSALVRGRLENAHDIRHSVRGTAPTVAEPDTVNITDFSAEPYRKVWQS